MDEVVETKIKRKNKEIVFQVESKIRIRREE